MCAIAIVAAFQFIPRPVDVPHISTAKIGDTILSLTLADSPEERERGLGGRDGLQDDEAMLFIFGFPARHEFWMKNMKFPIDILWLDEHFTIVYIAPHISPDTYPKTTFSPETDALYVLETNAGFSAKNDLKVGDAIEINLKK